jgi:hypothetical protein
MKSTKVTNFRVPTLAEADTEYAAMSEKLVELNDAYGKTKRNILALEADIKARPSPAMKPGVAALLGESVDASLLGRASNLADLRKHLADVEAAQAIVKRSLADRRSLASVAACRMVKAEYGTRVAAIVSALEAVDVARQHAEEILSELERNDVALSYLPPLRPSFLGDMKDGRLAQYVKDAKEAGYVG